MWAADKAHKGFTSMLDMTQGLFGKILLRTEPSFPYPEGLTQVASIGFFFLRDFVDPSVSWEYVGVRQISCGGSSTRKSSHARPALARQYLTVPACSASPERLFGSVGLVKSDLRGSLWTRDTTLIDVMLDKLAP